MSLNNRESDSKEDRPTRGWVMYYINGTMIVGIKKGQRPVGVRIACEKGGT